MRRIRGFTLVEILVAVLVAAILSVMAFSAMRQALDNRERVRQASQRLQALQSTIRTLVQDFSQLEPRPVREPLGEGYQPALRATGGTAQQVVFTRAGWANPAGGQRSTLQRVRYGLRDGNLYREHWTVLDATLASPPVPRLLIGGVRAFRLRFMNDGRTWQEDWPPPQPAAGPPGERTLRWRPIAVEVTIELEDWGVITRIVEIAA